MSLLNSVLLYALSISITMIYIAICWFAIWYCSLSRQNILRVLVKGDEHERSKKEGKHLESKKRLKSK